MCPHILRYLTTAVIINKQNRRTMLKDLVKVIQQVNLILDLVREKMIGLILVDITRNRTPIEIRLQSSSNTCTSTLTLMPPSRNCVSVKMFCSTTSFSLPSWTISLRMLGSWFSKLFVGSISALASSNYPFFLFNLTIVSRWQIFLLNEGYFFLLIGLLFNCVSW